MMKMTNNQHNNHYNCNIDKDNDNHDYNDDIHKNNDNYDDNDNNNQSIYNEMKAKTNKIPKVEKTKNLTYYSLLRERQKKNFSRS